MKKGDICLVNLAIEVGHEQFGKRPAILVSDTKAGIAVIIPLTGDLEALRYPYTLAILPDSQNKLDKESAALIFHLRAIDKSRIIKVIGKLNKEGQRKIDRILKEMLKL